MKVAICLSGLIGGSGKWGRGKNIDYAKTKFFLEKSFINQNIEFFYFLHCWSNDFEQNLLKLYSPQEYLFEKPIKRNSKYNLKAHNIISNHYSKKKVIKLKEKYEKENKISFDIVILTRFDILIYPKLNLYNLDRKKFYIAGPKKHHGKRCSCRFCDDKNENHSLNDYIFIGSSADMDKFSLAYDYINEYTLHSNHIVTKQHILKVGLWKKVDYVFKSKTNKYPHIWRLLEHLNLFPKYMVPARIYDTNIPLTRWVDKSLYLKVLDFIIFKLRLDIIFYYLIIKPYTVINLFIRKF